MIMLGCNQFNAIFTFNNNIYHLTSHPTTSSSLSTRSSFQSVNAYIQLINPQIDLQSPCILYKTNHLASSSSPTAINISHLQLNININIQKSLIYQLDNDNNDNLNLINNLFKTFHLTSVYLNDKLNTKLNINRINFVHFNTNRFLNLDESYYLNNMSKQRSNELNINILDNFNTNTSECIIIQSNNTCIDMKSVLFIKYTNSSTTLTNQLTNALLRMAFNVDRDDFNLIDVFNGSIDLNEINKNCLNKCGNGVIDENEDCDCGMNNCDLNCCNQKTCKFHDTSYQCASGDCCFKCKLSVLGVVCRAKNDNLCDIDEKCDGESPEVININ